MTFEIKQGDALTRLREMEAESVQCCVTSPPYYGLRDYNSPPTVWGGSDDCDHEWGANLRTPRANSVSGPNGRKKNKDVYRNDVKETGPYCLKCDAWKGCLGLEPTPQLFVRNLVLIFNEVRRVLRKDGVCWLNLGDSYAGSGCGWGGGSISELSNHHSKVHGQDDPRRSKDQKPPMGYKAKDLMGIPWRVAFALQDTGWWLRQDIIWSKPNPMPESVTDRCTKAHEYIFLLTKSAKYYFDQEAIKEPLKDASVARLIQDVENQDSSDRVPGKTNGNMKAVRFGGNNRCPDTRLQSGNEWKPKNLSVEGRKNHSFHESRAEGNEWQPKGRDRTNGNRNGEGASTLDKKAWDPTQHSGSGNINKNRSGYFDKDTGEPLCGSMANKKSVWTVTTQPFKGAHFATFPQKLIEPMILAGSRVDDVILDPFSGAGTTGLVAIKHRRNYLGIELNPDYIEMSERRLRDVQVNLF